MKKEDLETLIKNTPAHFVWLARHFPPRFAKSSPKLELIKEIER